MLRLLQRSISSQQGSETSRANDYRKAAVRSRDGSQKGVRRQAKAVSILEFLTGISQLMARSFSTCLIARYGIAGCAGSLVNTNIAIPRIRHIGAQRRANLLIGNQSAFGGERQAVKLFQRIDANTSFGKFPTVKLIGRQDQSNIWRIARAASLDCRLMISLNQSD
jgi:hypothetical protein